MARIKTKDLKTQYMVRVYDQEEYELLKRALEKFKDKFDSLNDAIKYFSLLGADKMLGDNNLNQSINFSEIRKSLQSIDNQLTEISGRQEIDFKETNIEIKVNQSLLNLATFLLQKMSSININKYTNDRKYNPIDEYGLEEERIKHTKEYFDDWTR